MSSHYDIEMTTDDTLELDTIIEQIDNSNSITKVNKGGDHNINVIDTQTKIFDPIDSGEYELDINGQIISVNVTESSAIPDSGDLYTHYDAQSETASTGTAIYPTDQSGNGRDFGSGTKPTLTADLIGVQKSGMTLIRLLPHPLVRLLIRRRFQWLLKSLTFSEVTKW